MWKNKKKYPIKEEGLYILVSRYRKNLFINLEFWKFTDEEEVMTWYGIETNFYYFNCNRFEGKLSEIANAKYLINIEGTQVQARIEGITMDNLDISEKFGIYAIMHDEDWEGIIVKDEVISYLRIPLNQEIFHGIIPNEQLVPITAKKRLDVFKRDKFKCKQCGKSPANEDKIQLEVDHIYPTSLGGSNHFNNLQTLCNICNGVKSNRVIYFRN